MCKLRTYRHNCGHLTHRPISTCRFTFASNARALCQASPELTLTLPDDCRACQYATFCTTWETRIADARTRQSTARMHLRDILLKEPSDELAWGGFHDGNETHACFTDYTESARRKRDACDHDVETLWAQYQHEQWAHWRPLVTGPNHHNESPNKQRLRRRRTSSRCSGDSPLRHVTSASDYISDLEPLPTPLSAEEESYAGDDELEETESPTSEEGTWSPVEGCRNHNHTHSDPNETEDDATSAPSFDGSDDSGTTSPDSSSDDDDEDSTSSKSSTAPPSPRTPTGSQENLTTLRNWAWPPGASHSLTHYKASGGPIIHGTGSHADPAHHHHIGHHHRAERGEVGGHDAMKSLRESLKQWGPEIVVAGGLLGDEGRGRGGGKGGEDDLQLPAW